MAAECVTPEAINFMATHGRGLICLTLTPERLRRARAAADGRANNETPYETAFTVSIEAREGIATGISAADRARTIRVAIDPDDGPARHRPARATCSRCAPARAACSSAPARPRPRSTSPGSPGCTPAGVICEIMKDDGTMARRAGPATLLRASTGSSSSRSPT